MEHLIQHREEIAWAAVFAILFAFLLEIINPGSHIRAKLRQLNNLWSAQSNSLLAKRIEELEKYKKKLLDVRWQYLYAFQIVFMILFSFCLGSACWVMSSTELFRINPTLVEQLSRLSLCCFAVGAGFSIIGITHVWRDTPEKVQAVVRKLSNEIENLQETLRKRSRL